MGHKKQGNQHLILLHFTPGKCRKYPDKCRFFRVTLIFWGLSKKFMKSKEKKFRINNTS